MESTSVGIPRCGFRAIELATGARTNVANISWNRLEPARFLASRWNIKVPDSPQSAGANPPCENS
jgi:hypothetical protein